MSSVTENITIYLSTKPFLINLESKIQQISKKLDKLNPSCPITNEQLNTLVGDLEKIQAYLNKRAKEATPENLKKLANTISHCREELHICANKIQAYLLKLQKAKAPSNQAPQTRSRTYEDLTEDDFI